MGWNSAGRLMRRRHVHVMYIVNYCVDVLALLARKPVATNAQKALAEEWLGYQEHGMRGAIWAAATKAIAMAAGALLVLPVGSERIAGFVRAAQDDLGTFGALGVVAAA